MHTQLSNRAHVTGVPIFSLKVDPENFLSSLWMPEDCLMLAQLAGTKIIHQEPAQTF